MNPSVETKMPLADLPIDEVWVEVRSVWRLATNQPITVMRPRYCRDALLHAGSRRDEAVPKHHDRRAATDSR